MNFRKIISFIKENIKKLIHLRASAHEIALGIAIGIFIGIFPTFGLGVFVTLTLAPLIRFNVPAAFIGGTLLANPLLFPLWVYLSCSLVGIDISSIKSSEETIGMLIKHYSGVISLYVLGNTIVSSTVALLFYGITYGVVKLYRKHHPHKESV
ncbi:MAG: DUF2062 domain-containing protein [Fibrobacter sp.]|nr:DUF2062 domain-containing protein [Fibrobacter sp.]